MDYQDPSNLPIIRDKKMVERQFTRDQCRKAYQDKFDQRRKAYVYVQQKLITARDQANKGKRTGGKRIDYMLNHTKYDSIGEIKKKYNDHVIKFAIYQDKEEERIMDKHVLVEQLRGNIKDNF